jgi:DNA gyrase subunit A
MAREQDKVLLVSEKGYGKLTQVDKFRKQARAGKGVKSFRITDKSGMIADAKIVTTTEGAELVLVSSKAQVTRINLDETPVQSRITRGVIVWRPHEGADHLVAVACYSVKDKDITRARVDDVQAQVAESGVTAAQADEELIEDGEVEEESEEEEGK